MISKSVALAFVLALLSPFAEGNTGEVLQGKLYNRDVQYSETEIHEKVKKADLENHGYSKEVTTSQVAGPSSNHPRYQKSYFYYKVVNCSRIPEIEQELDTLIPGVLGKEVANRLGKEMKHRRLNDMGQCKVGFEILFKETELRKRTRRSKTTVQCTVKYESNDDKDDDGGWFWSRRRR